MPLSIQKSHQYTYEDDFERLKTLPPDDIKAKDSNNTGVQHYAASCGRLSHSSMGC